MYTPNFLLITSIFVAMIVVACGTTAIEDESCNSTWAECLRSEFECDVLTLHPMDYEEEPIYEPMTEGRVELSYIPINDKTTPLLFVTVSHQGDGTALAGIIVGEQRTAQIAGFDVVFSGTETARYARWTDNCAQYQVSLLPARERSVSEETISALVENLLATP